MRRFSSYSRLRMERRSEGYLRLWWDLHLSLSCNPQAEKLENPQELSHSGCGFRNLDQQLGEDHEKFGRTSFLMLTTAGSGRWSQYWASDPECSPSSLDKPTLLRSSSLLPKPLVFFEEFSRRCLVTTFIQDKLRTTVVLSSGEVGNSLG